MCVSPNASVRVVHGANDGFFPVSGETVGCIKASLRDAFNLPPEAIAFANGRQVHSNYCLLRNEVLEFVLEWGQKGGRKKTVKEPVPAVEEPDATLIAWLNEQAIELKNLEAAGMELRINYIRNARDKGKVLAKVQDRLVKFKGRFESWVFEHTDIGHSTALLWIDVAENYEKVKERFHSNPLESLREFRDAIRDIRQENGGGKPGSGRRKKSPEKAEQIIAGEKTAPTDQGESQPKKTKTASGKVNLVKNQDATASSIQGVHGSDGGGKEFEKEAEGESADSTPKAKTDLQTELEEITVRLSEIAQDDFSRINRSKIELDQLLTAIFKLKTSACNLVRWFYKDVSK